MFQPLAARPAFESGSDGKQIALTYRGISVCGGEDWRREGGTTLVLSPPAASSCSCRASVSVSVSEGVCVRNMEGGTGAAAAATVTSIYTAALTAGAVGAGSSLDESERSVYQ